MDERPTRHLSSAAGITQTWASSPTANPGMRSPACRRSPVRGAQGRGEPTHAAAYLDDVVMGIRPRARLVDDDAAANHDRGNEAQ